MRAAAKTDTMAMMRCECDLVGMSPISFSKHITTRKGDKESDDAWEQRCWRERTHVDSDGHVFIPAMALKKAISNSAQYLSEKIQGKGNSTYTKRVVAGTMVIDDMILLDRNGQPYTVDDLEGERLFVPSNGKPGSGTRVWRTFPVAREWRTKAVVYALEPLLIENPHKVQEYLEHSGKFVGLLRFRPQNNGVYGRYSVENFTTSDV